MAPLQYMLLSANARGIQSSAAGYVVMSDDWRCATNREQPDVPRIDCHWQPRFLVWVILELGPRFPKSQSMWKEFGCCPDF
jgi:hypothetical protein